MKPTDGDLLRELFGMLKTSMPEGGGEILSCGGNPGEDERRLLAKAGAAVQVDSLSGRLWVTVKLDGSTIMVPWPSPSSCAPSLPAFAGA